MARTCSALPPLLAFAAALAAAPAARGGEGLEGSPGPALGTGFREADLRDSAGVLFPGLPSSAGIEARGGPPGEETEGSPVPFFRCDLFVGNTLGSHTRVGEHADYGTTLRLKDLGVRWEEQVHLTFGRWYGPDNLLTCTLEDTILQGSARIPSDVHYNGATLQGGTDLSSHPLFLTLDTRYQRVVSRWGEDRRGSLALDLGVRYDRLHWYFSGTLAPSTTGHETGEGFDAQSMPIPEIGLALRQPLAHGVDLVAGFRGFRANAWPTGRTEGGAVHWSETYEEARAGVEWNLSRSAALTIQVRYELIDMWERSHEDRNAITLRTLGLMIGLRLDF
jgi:hypothetical protein